MHTGESAINKGLANRLAELEVEREERDRAELEEECGIEADTYEALPDPAEDATEGLRHDVNNLTHFVDRLSIRCEDFFRRNAGLEEARKREAQDEERRARLACVDALQALRDGVGAFLRPAIVFLTPSPRRRRRGTFATFSSTQARRAASRA